MMQIEPELPNPLQKFQANFTREERLGEGTYGLVTRAFDIHRRKTVAIKKVKLENCDDEGLPATSIREISILRKLKHHANVVELYEVKYFPEEKKLFLVFESLQSDLKLFLDKSSNLSLRDVKCIVYQILCGLTQCHSRRILHRDLKPQNILVGELDQIRNVHQVKLADFGLARKFTREIATLWYRSPELMLGDEHYGTGVDIWAVGCIMAECLNRRPLFPGDSQIDMLFKIMELLGTPSDQNYVGLSKLPHFKLQFPKFKGKELKVAVPLLESDAGGLEVLQSMLQFNPGKRPQAKELLKHAWFDEVRLLFP